MLCNIDNGKQNLFNRQQSGKFAEVQVFNQKVMSRTTKGQVTVDLDAH